MQDSLDKEKTLELIERMKLARIGEYKMWEKIANKLHHGIDLNEEDVRYFSSLSRTYKDAKITSRTKIYHMKLSEEDSKPPCKTCGSESLFYCNMNDAYYCHTHVVGHDENES